MIGGDIIREMTIDTDQKYQENVEAAANMPYQLKKIIRSIKGMIRWIYEMWRKFRI